MIKTIVELDLKGYSDIAREIEEHFTAEVVLHFNAQIQSFISDALKRTGVEEEAIMATTGDGAILAFDAPSLAHDFAVAVHQATRLHNHTRTLPQTQRHFRIGIATGDLALKEVEGKRQMAGSVIARAVRLEAGGKVGEIVVDTATYAALTVDQQACFEAEEQIPGKRDEVFPARRYIVVANAAADWTSAVKAASAPKPATKPSGALKRWQEKVDFLEGQLAFTSGAAQKFEIHCLLAEAKERIAELGG